MSQFFKLGTDPEFFLMEDDKYISAHNIVPGTKKKPEPLPDGSHVQADGTAVEFNIEPAVNAKEFTDKIQSALNELRKIIPIKYKFLFEPIVTYSEQVWKEIPTYAKELGCDPDYRICGDLSFARNRIPDPGKRRTGSGHLHFGWTNKENTEEGSDHFLDCVGFSNSFLNLSYVYNDRYDYQNRDRQNYYGYHGAFRCKPYGVELRSLSNKWVPDKEISTKIAEYSFALMKYEFDNGPSPDYYRVFSK